MDEPVPRAIAEQLDARDPVASFRERFVVADEHAIYLDGNSLGRLPAATPALLDTVVREGWGAGLVTSWHSWIDWGTRLGDRLAASVLSARPGEVAISDSTSVNLYKLAVAALDAAPGRGTIVCDAADFPTNRYVLQGVAEARGLRIRTVQTDLDGGCTLDELHRILDRDVALVCLSLVSYRSGALLDMGAVNDAAREAGALVLWDLSHAAGAVPVRLTAERADLAVGCTYKYLNAGPGAPAFLFVRRELQPALRQPVWGWFGQRNQFDMGPDYDPVEGVERFLVGTPPILSMAPIEAALDIVEQAGVDRIRAKGVQLGRLMVDLTEHWLAPYGFRLASPRAAASRGSHICLEHAEAWRICRALAINAGIICDFREPSRLRIGPSPLYTRFVDVWDAMHRLRQMMADREYESVGNERPRVT
ncbi:MAG TPA: kynureninase [Micromonosporaceae bacterium]|nr:kynureninase [Micromonosporaceae bacterium]